MRRRLFWKILFAFWLTFLAITQGVWLMFTLSSDDRPRAGQAGSDPMTSVILLSAAEIVRHAGVAGFERYLVALPERQRARLELRRATGPSAQTMQAAAPLLTTAVTGPNGEEYEVRARSPAGRRLPLLNTPPEMLALGLFGGLVFSAALAWYLTEPINRLRLGFEHLARGNLDTRIDGRISRRRDEIADLARDFDVMADRLEELVKARDRLLHDVSHELRSPLARLQLAIGLARQAPARVAVSLERIEQEASRLDMLVGELLALARAEQGDLRGDAYFDVVEVVRMAVEDARFAAQNTSAAIELAEDIPPEDMRPPLRGDAELVRRAIDNALRNALRFCPAQSSVHVTVRFDSDGHLYIIKVADRGPGVPEGNLAAIFEPFVRGAGETDGLGLGLAIASRAVIAHGGTIDARNREGGGLVIRIKLASDML